MEEVRVRVGQDGYSIYIGQHTLAQLGSLMGRNGLTGKALVLTDAQVGALYGEQVLGILAEAGFTAELFAVPPGEDSKSLAVAETVFSKAITMGLDRKSVIVALGGGVVGDLAGFIAATYLRGIPFVQVPTTLLAQVDSSVGGKVAVNHALGKNLIGAFYQPRLVLIDIALLQSLPERELASGLAEVIKYGIIEDADLFSYLQKNSRPVLAKEPEALQHIIKRSCEIKAGVVEQDEKENSLRMILNFGHTMGHAVEADTGFGLYSHGESVAIGMAGAASLSAALGLCSQETVDTIRGILAQYKLPLGAPECTAGRLLPFLVRDKKAVGGKIHWVLVRSIGSILIKDDVPPMTVDEILQEITC